LYSAYLVLRVLSMTNIGSEIRVCRFGPLQSSMKTRPYSPSVAITCNTLTTFLWDSFKALDSFFNDRRDFWNLLFGMTFTATSSPRKKKRNTCFTEYGIQVRECSVKKFNLHQDGHIFHYLDPIWRTFIGWDSVNVIS
jgi:hypothetical protein